MTYEAMGQILEWIKKASGDQVTDVERFMYPAMFCLAWQLWLRINEVERLRFCDIL